MNASELRSHYRQLRRDLDHTEQHRHAARLAERIDQYIGLRGDLRIAAYLAVQGEISLGRWIEHNRYRQRIYLPRLYEPVEPRLRFAPLDDNTVWTRNRFRIVEPGGHWGNTLSGQSLDLVLMPLVAFDRQGHRLGMGGGYYDRSMAFRRWRRHWKKPLLVGVAHSQQEHPRLPHNPWDVALDVIITEREIIRV